MSREGLFTRRKIGVCGSSKELPPAAIPLCEALGARLARDRFAVIVSGGTLRRLSAPPNDLSADWHMVSAATKALGGDPEAPGPELDERIETVLSRAERS